MGNTICQNHQAVHFQNKTPQELAIMKNKQITSQARSILQKQKPYEKQLSQKNLNFQILGQNIYHGETNRSSKPNGIGKLYRSDCSVFVGKFNNGLAHGVGYLVFPNGDYYEGIFVKDQANDPKGKLVTKSTVYIGGFKQSLFDGQGELITDYSHFKGQFKQGKMLDGCLKWKDLNRYDCQYNGKFDKNQRFTGTSKLKNRQGFYEGNFIEGMKHGMGKFIYNNGLVYEGQYSKDQKQGEGILYNKNSTIAYKGQWKNNLPNGQGKYLNSKIQLVDGEFINGIEKAGLIQHQAE